MRQLVVCAAAVFLLTTSPLLAQHLGARQQWQPEISDTDSRLQQPVEIEILGRAAVPALKLLSDATGVSLSVAPEDLTTVGERKLTIISKGLTLKAIMVQLPNALQECHWDIDATGDEPIYLLHRNGSAGAMIASLLEAASEPERQARRRRIEEARAALKMSPAELAQLEQTDLYLARTMKEPTARACVEAFLALPPSLLERFIVRGGVSILFPDLPRGIQDPMIDTEQYPAYFATRGGSRPSRSEWADDLRKRTISIVFARSSGAVDAMVFFRGSAYTHLTIIPPRRAPRPDLDVSAHLSRGTARPSIRGAGRSPEMMPRNRLLTATGTPGKREADRIIIQAELGHEQSLEKAEVERRSREWTGRSDPGLQQLIDLGDTHDPLVEFVHLQQKLSVQTGFSVVSDFFSGLPGHAPPAIWSESAAPLWRLLHLAAEDADYQWEKAGDCLVFHHAKWYERVQSELPERLLFPFIRKYCAGELTLDDICAVVMTRKPRDGALPAPQFPRQLSCLHLNPRRLWSIQAYAALDSEQRAALRRPEGVKVADLPPAARDIVVSRVTDPDVLTSQSREDFEQAVFHLEEAEKSSDGGTIVTSLLYLEFPGGARHSARLWFPRFASDITYTPVLHADPQPPS